jgi:crotonobetainyl-CoA:carnitine CoA-transferase CaiB-like acyl-CoA transferase
VTLPLAGIRILDLTRVLAGPLATMTLGDLGADVIKIERPGSGDESREWGPPFDSRGESAYYLSINRNKLSLALDFDKPADLDVFYRPAGGCRRRARQLPARDARAARNRRFQTFSNAARS